MKIVIKIGTSTLTHKSGQLNIRQTETLCKIFSDLKNAGHEIILVSSGAIAMGVGKLPITGKPEDMKTKQAAAAVGQSELMYTYDKLFSEYNHTVAQMLITASDIKYEDRKENFINTLNRLLELNVIPIINENNCVATEEISIGDNDTLAAIVATSANADLLILLSDVDGLYTGNPSEDENATLISEIHEIDQKIEDIAGSAGTTFGTGGMITKIGAAKICKEGNCDMIITNGSKPELLYNIIDGEKVGTRFFSK